MLSLSKIVGSNFKNYIEDFNLYYYIFRESFK